MRFWEVVVNTACIAMLYGLGAVVLWAWWLG